MMRVNFGKRVPVAAFLIFLILPSSSAGQPESPIHIELSASSSVYIGNTPITMQVRVYNCDKPLQEEQICASSRTVATQQGFYDQDWKQAITFSAPDGSIIRHRGRRVGVMEPQGTFIFDGRHAVVAGLVPPGTSGPPNIVTLDDAKKYYDLNQYGIYSAQITVPLQIFDDYQRDPLSGEVLGFYPPSRTFSPLESNRVTFKILPLTPISDHPSKPARSAVYVYVDHMQILGSGTYPKVTKMPIEKTHVRLYRLSSVPSSFQPVTWQTGGEVVQYVKLERSGITDSKGLARFFVERDDYVVIADCYASGDFRYLIGFIDKKDRNWYEKDPLKIYIRTMRTAKDESGKGGKLLPGKTHVVEGKDLKEIKNLLITEPESMTRPDENELYPIVFESEGKYSIALSISAPEGLSIERMEEGSGAVPSIDVLKVPRAVQYRVRYLGAASPRTEVGITYTITPKSQEGGILKKLDAIPMGTVISGKTVIVEEYADPEAVFMGGKRVKQE